MARHFGSKSGLEWEKNRDNIRFEVHYFMRRYGHSQSRAIKSAARTLKKSEAEIRKYL